jgi:hypothetical protein
MTLLETLVALVILSLAIGAALNMTRTARTLYAAAERRQQAVEIAFSEAFLRDQLEGIAPVVVNAGDGSPVMDFNGAPYKISFIASKLTAAEAPAPQLTTISINGGVLSMRRAPVHSPQSGQSRILATYPFRVAFRYAEFGVNGGMAREDSWNARTGLPAAIILQRESADPAQETILVVASPALIASR